MGMFADLHETGVLFRQYAPCIGISGSAQYRFVFDGT